MCNAEVIAHNLYALGDGVEPLSFGTDLLICDGVVWRKRFLRRFPGRAGDEREHGDWQNDRMSHT
jgi:hypothetical protein